MTDAYGVYYRGPQLGVVGVAVATPDGRLGARDEVLKRPAGRRARRPREASVAGSR